MAKANPHLFESIAYVARLVRVNAALSDCLGVPLDAVRGAAKYERARVALATPTVWPGDVIARAQKYVTDFPWIVPLFESEKPGGVCPVWAQVTEDWAASETVEEEIGKRVWNHPFLSKSSKAGTVDGVLSKPHLEVVLEAARIIIGKAKYLHDAVSPDGNWLKEALRLGNTRFYDYLAVIATGKVKLPGRDQTIAAAGPESLGEEPPPDEKRSRRKPKTTNLTGIQDRDDESLGQDLLGEGREPSPEAGTIEEELHEDISKLTQQEQAVITKLTWEEKTLKQTAGEMGCSVHQVVKYRDSALNKLRVGRTDV